MAFAKLNSMKFVGLDGLSHFWSKAKAYTDTVCCNTINRDTLCLACSYACANTKSLCSCTYAGSIGTSCKSAACTYANSVAGQCKGVACTYSASCIGTMSTLCTTCAKAYTDTVCRNTISRDTLCLSCAKAYSDTKASCACTYAGSIGTSCKNAACAFAVTCGNAVCCNTITRDTLCLSCAYTCSSGIGTACKNAACAFAVTCSHAIGTACKNAAMATKANCYGNSYSCVANANTSKNVEMECWNAAAQRYVYIGQPNTSKNVGCNANFWFCPTCNVLKIGGTSGGSAICLTGLGSCFMNGVCSRLNPSIVFATTDNQCGCLQYSQYDAVHNGAGLCWATNTTNSWFDTDCVFANKFINRNGCQIGGYCVTLPSAGGKTNYALLSLGAVETSVYFSVHDNEGTIVKAITTEPYGKVYAQNTYGITGFYSLGTERAANSCFWLRYNGWRSVNLWGKYPIKVVSNTTTNPGCTWQSPTIKPTCDYVSTVAGQCKSAACTYANSVAGQCKGVACTYSYCAINASKGASVMGVARAINGQCWASNGYFAYMTTLDGPNCCWNHVIKMDWASNNESDIWKTGISIPTSNAPKYGIYYKAGCCAGHSGWTLVPSISCVQKLSGSCASSIGTSCKNAACAFAAACAAAVVPETSTFAKCYGNSTSCVECAAKIRLNAFSSNVYYKIPFASTTGTTATNGCLIISSYPSYNPNSRVSCVYTECVAKTLAVPNGNGCFRLGSYCIYIG